MERYGTKYGGWSLPKQNILNENSIVYSGGVGEDMSFDLNIHDKYGCNIILIDPTHKAIKHYQEVKNYYNTSNFSFTGNIQKDYINNIKNLQIDFNKFHFLDKGLHSSKGVMKFYKQVNPNYVSQSLISNMFGNEYYNVEVDTIANIMTMYNHKHIDLLKLDIEGSEVEVLNKMLDDEIYPTYLCIEFDLKLKNKDNNNSTEKLIERLKSNNYKILLNENLNITFEKK